MSSLIDKLESNFDPSDVDGAMQLAYTALRLAAHAAFAIETDNANSLMGRDQKTELSVAVIDIAERLHILPYYADGLQVNELFRNLVALGRRP